MTRHRHVGNPLKVVGLAIVVALVSCGTVFAQQTRASSPNSGSQGVSGGTAGPQGTGLGGTTAGSPSTGGSGASTGPGSVNQNRYGGPVPPAPPPTPNPTPVAAPGAPIAGSTDLDAIARGDLCADYRYAALTPQQRMVNPNLRRLDFAQRYLAPGFDARDDQTAIRILANYQEEMEKPRPNVLIAGTYIAMVATVSVTAAVVEQLNAILCVAGAPKRVAAIADAVKQQQTK